MNYSLNI